MPYNIRAVRCAVTRFFTRQCARQRSHKGDPLQNIRFIRFLALFFVAGLVYAQPSGGPYGPIDQRYEIPNAGPNTGKVYFVAPDGKSDAVGTELAHPTT